MAERDTRKARHVPTQRELNLAYRGRWALHPYHRDAYFRITEITVSKHSSGSSGTVAYDVLGTLLSLERNPSYSRRGSVDRYTVRDYVCETWHVPPPVVPDEKVHGRLARVRRNQDRHLFKKKESK